MNLKLSTAVVDITPRDGCALAGFAGRTGNWQQIASPLCMSAVMLADEHDTLVFVSVDALSIGQALNDHVCRKLAPIQASNILISATHTHFAPALDVELPGLGPVSDAYLEQVLAASSRLVADLLSATPTPCVIRKHTHYARLTVNRRAPQRLVPWPLAKWLPQVISAPAPGEASEDPLELIGFYKTSDGESPNDGESPDELLALIWSLACHPVCTPDLDSVSADFIGEVRGRLHARVNREIPVVFLQGFAGDRRPNIQRLSLKPRRLAKSLLTLRPTFDDGNQRAWQHWLDQLTAEFLDGLQAVGEHDPIPPADICLSGQSTSVPVSQLQQQPSEVPDRLWLQHLRIARTLGIFAGSGEWVAGWARCLPAHVVPTAYSHHLFGYLPTNRQCAEGGYEVDGFRPAFGLEGRYLADLETPVQAALKDLFQDRSA